MRIAHERELIIQRLRITTESPFGGRNETLLEQIKARGGEVEVLWTDAGLHIASLRGLDVDQPRNLAKSMTVQ